MTEIEEQILYNQVIIMETLSASNPNLCEVEDRNLWIYINATLDLIKKERVKKDGK